jgi:hypothetical protein
MLREHPDYSKFELGVPAQQALDIVFEPSDSLAMGAETMEIVDGSELVIHRTRQGRVTSIEII